MYLTILCGEDIDINVWATISILKSFIGSNFVTRHGQTSWFNTVYKNVLNLAFTYIDNKESCSNQQGTCCIVFHELRTYRDTVRCMDRTRYHMSPKDYTRKLKKE